MIREIYKSKYAANNAVYNVDKDDIRRWNNEYRIIIQPLAFAKYKDSNDNECILSGFNGSKDVDAYYEKSIDIVNDNESRFDTFIYALSYCASYLFYQGKYKEFYNLINNIKFEDKHKIYKNGSYNQRSCDIAFMPGAYARNMDMADYLRAQAYLYNFYENKEFSGYNNIALDIANQIQNLSKKSAKDVGDINSLFTDPIISKAISKALSTGNVNKKLKEVKSSYDDRISSLRGLDFLEQSVYAVEDLIDYVDTEGSSNTWYYYNSIYIDKKDHWKLTPYIKEIESNPERFVNILKSYLQEKYAKGKKYAKLEDRLAKIDKLLNILDIGYSINDIVDGLPTKIIGRAITGLIK